MTLIIVAILAYLGGVFTVAVAIVVGDEFERRHDAELTAKLEEEWRHLDANAATWQRLMSDQRHKVMMGVERGTDK